MLYQLAYQRVGVGERKRLLLRYARRELDPAAPRVETPQDELESLSVDPLGGIDATHVLQHETSQRLQDRLAPVVLLLRFHQIVHGPAVLMRARHHALVDRLL